MGLQWVCDDDDDDVRTGSALRTLIRSIRWRNAFMIRELPRRREAACVRGCGSLYTAFGTKTRRRKRLCGVRLLGVDFSTADGRR